MCKLEIPSWQCGTNMGNLGEDQAIVYMKETYKASTSVYSCDTRHCRVLSYHVRGLETLAYGHLGPLRLVVLGFDVPKMIRPCTRTHPCMHATQCYVKSSTILIRLSACRLQRTSPSTRSNRLWKPVQKPHRSTSQCTVSRPSKLPP